MDNKFDAEVETIHTFPHALLAKVNAKGEKKVLNFLEDKKVDIFPEGKILEIHFQQKEDRKMFEEHFPKIPNRNSKPKKK